MPASIPTDSATRLDPFLHVPFSSQVDVVFIRDLSGIFIEHDVRTADDHLFRVLSF